MAKPLYEALKGMDPEPLHGTGNLQSPFDPDKCSSLGTQILTSPLLHSIYLYRKTGTSAGSSHPKSRKKIKY